MATQRDYTSRMAGEGGYFPSFLKKDKAIPYADFDGNIAFSGSVTNFSGYCEVLIKPTTVEYAHIIALAKFEGTDPWVVLASVDAAYTNTQTHIQVPIIVDGTAELKISVTTGQLDPISNIIGYLRGLEFKE